MTCKISTRTSYSDIEIKSDKWKNLYFTKDGQNFLDVIIFPSEKTAQEDVLKLDLITIRPKDTIHAEDNSWNFFQKDFSHVIQIPVM